MIVYDMTVRDRYAQALFNVGKRRGNQTELLQEIDQLLPMFGPHAKFRIFLEAPQISTEAKQQLLDRAVKDNADPLIHQLFSLLLKKGRMSYVHPIFDQFRVLVERDQGIFEAEMATAVALDDDQRAQLLKALEAYTGSTLRIRHRVDPDLIGGVWFKYGDTLIDDTVKGKLIRMRQQLQQAVAL